MVGVVERKSRDREVDSVSVGRGCDVVGPARTGSWFRWVDYMLEVICSHRRDSPIGDVDMSVVFHLFHWLGVPGWLSLVWVGRLDLIRAVDRAGFSC